MKVAGLIISPDQPREKDLRATDLIGDLSAIARMTLTLEQAGVEDIALLYQPDNKALEREVAYLGITLLYHSAGEELNLLEKLKAGISYLKAHSSQTEPVEQLVIAYTHAPLFTAQTVRTLLARDEAVVRPCTAQAKGFPLVLRKESLVTLEELTTLEALERFFDTQTHCVEVPDVGVTITSRHQPDFRKALEQHSLQKLRPEIKVRLGREKPFLGPGTSQLLSLIEPTGSVREACQRMGISYSKGWNMITLIEEQLGQQVVERQQGGKRGGSAHLTLIGKELLQRFIAYERACHQNAEELFDEYFGDFDPEGITAAKETKK